MSISLSILTWKSPKTLEALFKSLSPVVEVFQDVNVICQESDQAEVELVKKWGFNPILVAENIGIQNGLKLCVESAKSDFVLVLENDNRLVNNLNLDVFDEIVRKVSYYLSRGDIDFCRLGIPDSFWKFDRYWLMGNPLRRTFKGIVRKAQADAYKGLAYYKDPVLFKSEAIDSIDDFYIFSSNSKYLAWTNRAFITRKDSFLELIDFAESKPTSKKVNGLPDLEDAICGVKNRSWWRKADYNVGQVVPGIFGHDRYDRPLSDEKFGLDEVRTI